MNTHLASGAPIRPRNQATLDAVRGCGADRPILLHGAHLVTMEPSLGDLACGDVLLLDGRIVDVGADLSTDPRSTNAIVVDCRGLILGPGFQDTHRHAWQGQLRRLLPDVDIEGYMMRMHATMAHHFAPEDMYVGNVVAAVGAIDAGITTVLDFCHNSRTCAHSDAAIAAWDDTGIRAVHASAAPLDGKWDEQWPADLSRLAGHLPSSGLVTLRMALLTRAHELIPEVVGLNPANLAVARDLGLQVSVDGVHGANAAAELVRQGQIPGTLGADITYIHCTALSDTAWQYICDSGGTVSLAPTSDAQIGVADGMPPVQVCLDLGIEPSIGLDLESCLASDMFSQMRALLTLQRLGVYQRRAIGDENAPALLTDRDVLTFATIAGARANGLEIVSGSITPGKQADIIGVRTDDANLFPMNNAIGSLVQGADPRNIEFVLIAGRPVKWQRAVISFDIDHARRLAEQSRDRLLDAAGVRLDVTA